MMNYLIERSGIKGMSGKREGRSADAAPTENLQSEAKGTAEVKKELSTDQKAQEKLPKEKSRKRKGILIAGSIFLVLLLAAVGAYGGGTVYYQSHFLPNTSINGMDCGNRNAAEVVQMLDERINSYTLEVRGRDYRTGEPGALLGRVEPTEIHLAFDGTGEAVEAFLDGQGALGWIQAYFGKAASYELVQGVVFDQELLSSTVAAWDACKKENMLKPQDAYIGGYCEDTHCYEIIPETGGAQLDTEKLVQLAGEAILQQESSLDLEGQDCYTEAAVKQEDKLLTDAVDTINSWLGTKITYDWNGAEVILDYETLKDWVSIEEGVPVLDEDQVAEFVKAQAKQYDTYGKKRNFTTTLGVELTLPSGYYGWKTDREAEKEELVELIYQGSVTDREPVYSNTAMQKGMDDIGDSYVEVDITHQHVYLYQEGELVLETDCVTGNTSLDRATPEGVFCIAYRQKNAVLRGRDYETPVTYWMPFYGNYGMHDAYWRSAFGGKIYKTNGSRGCVNLPPSIAEEMFDSVRKGFPVICYYYKEDPLLNSDSNAASAGQAGSGTRNNTNTNASENNSGNASVPASAGVEGSGEQISTEESSAAGEAGNPDAPRTPEETAGSGAPEEPVGSGAPEEPAGSQALEETAGDQASPQVTEGEGQEPGMNDPVDPLPGT